jgi:CCR4-NOT transcriptional complex subunit CAF120
MKQGLGGQAVAQAIDQRQREQNQHAQRAAQAAYAQQQAQFAAQQGMARPQTPGNMNMMMGGGMSPSFGPQGQPRPQTPGSRMMGGGAPPYGPQGPQGQPRPQTPGNMMMGGGAPPYGPQGQPRPQTPGTRGMMMDGGAPSAYAPSMAGMNSRSMSPGPNMMMSPPGRYGHGPPHPRSQMGPHAGPYGGGSPGQGGWNAGNMPPRQGPQSPMMPSPNMGFGMQGGRPQSPAYQLPPQNQYAPPGTPGGPRPGTPGRMQYHGQAF